MTEGPQCTVPPVAAIGANADDTCASCGDPGDGLETVRRVYVALDERGQVTGSETMSNPERWCVSCRSLYPHVPGESGPGPGTTDAEGPPAAAGSS